MTPATDAPHQIEPIGCLEHSPVRSRSDRARQTSARRDGCTQSWSSRRSRRSRGLRFPARLTGDRCMAIAFRILRDFDLADDAVQSALLTAWRELRALRDPERFEPWLHRILTNACYAEAGVAGVVGRIRLLSVEPVHGPDDTQPSTTETSSSVPSGGSPSSSAPSWSSTTTSAFRCPRWRFASVSPSGP